MVFQVVADFGPVALASGFHWSTAVLKAKSVKQLPLDQDRLTWAARLGDAARKPSLGHVMGRLTDHDKPPNPNPMCASLGLTSEMQGWCPSPAFQAATPKDNGFRPPTPQLFPRRKHCVWSLEQQKFTAPFLPACGRSGKVQPVDSSYYIYIPSNTIHICTIQPGDLNISGNCDDVPTDHCLMDGGFLIPRWMGS
jgi:hypothetical protein